MIEDTSKVDELLEVLEDLKNTYVKIGLLGDSGRVNETLSVVDLGVIHEYGTVIPVTQKMRAFLHYQGVHLSKNTKHIKIPERSFIRKSYDEKQNKLMDLGKELDRVLSLELSVDDFYKLVGEYSVGIIQEYMTNLSKPANAPLTTQNKGSSNPLIDSGQLRSSIDFEIVRR